jgi:hypothetical protein
MTKAEKSTALFLAASAAGALLLVVCQVVAGGVLTRVLDLPDGMVWAGMGLRRFPVFKTGLFLAVLPLALDAAGEESLLRRLAVGFVTTAFFAWAATELVFREKDLAATYALLGLASTFASVFTGARRSIAAAALGLVVAATLLAAQGESLAEGKNFGAAVVLGLAFCGPAIAAVAFAPEAVGRALATLEERSRRG